MKIYLLPLCMLMLFFKSTYAQINCISELSEAELKSLQDDLEKRKQTEKNQFFLRLYEKIEVRNAVKVYFARLPYSVMDTFTFSSRIQDDLELQDNPLVMFYEKRKHKYKVIAESNLNPPEGIDFATMRSAKIISRILKKIDINQVCFIIIAPYINSDMFVLKNSELYIIKGKRLIEANRYFKKKYTVEEFKNEIYPKYGESSRPPANPNNNIKRKIR